MLFAVTPAKGKEALGKIKQALDLYLGFAGAKNFDSYPELSIQVERLQSRVMFFQSQLKLAQAEVKAQLAEVERQQATIKAQETTMMAQSVIISQFSAATVFAMAQQGALGKSNPDEDVKLFDGLVKLKEMELRPFGVSVSWANLIQWVKRWMADEQSTSDLATYLKTTAAKESGRRSPELSPTTDDQ